MKGLFITNELSPGEGPQLSSAVAGEKMRLQARVYNYSLKEMLPGTTVHVRFYLQPSDSSTQKPAGESKLIVEDKLSRIPPFNTDRDAPLNWVLANATLETTPHENQDLTFWVVVWMEDRDGKMVPEIAAHGLERIPGELKSLADVRTEPYSNNVGFFKSIFHVFPKSSLAAQAKNRVPILSVEKPELSSLHTALGRSVRLSAPLSFDDDVSNVMMFFYDGDPQAGGTLFALESAPFVDAQQTYLAKELYQPNTCGNHDLYVVVNKEASGGIAHHVGAVTVDCSPSEH